jgi:hypothetical protein
MKTTVIISVSGGVVEAAYAASPVEVVVADFDNYAVGAELCSQLEVEPLENADDLIREHPLVEQPIETQGEPHELLAHHCPYCGGTNIVTLKPWSALSSADPDTTATLEEHQCRDCANRSFWT